MASLARGLVPVCPKIVQIRLTEQFALQNKRLNPKSGSALLFDNDTYLAIDKNTPGGDKIKPAKALQSLKKD